MGLEDARHTPEGAVLWPAAGTRVFTTRRLELPAPLDEVGAYFWSVTWRREERSPFRQEVLSHPLTHLTVEAAEGGVLHGLAVPAALVHGLVTRVFSVDLPVAGRVAGVAFRPGGLAALLGRGVHDLTDAVVPAGEVLPGVAGLAGSVLAEEDDAARRDVLAVRLEGLLAPRLREVREDPGYRTVREAVRLMRVREHVALGPVAQRLHVSGRTLQRLFTHYVGASPLWVLRRHRLQDAVAALDAGGGEDLAELAASLGFADHAHLTRAFTAVVGVPPSRYRAGER
ncbi:helix-turn-helix domain-containing protein [Georgenia sp. 311]|uniref:AraC family transcriptional regulator n=1 Tax=Georgenia sp. 311 TaxID=2585134 RepID=UPI00159B8689|nr:helix-turn-helix domain-containing protein [Georgenia sp. 311]